MGFQLERFFAGRTVAHGTFIDRFGTARAEFIAECFGRVEGDTLTLTEQFSFLGGSSERREWRIRKVAPGRYEGRCAELPGVARGEVKGHRFMWSYPFHLRMGARTLKVHYRDTMVQVSEGVVLNMGQVSKFGIRLGEVIIAFEKPQTQAPLSRVAAE